MSELVYEAEVAAAGQTEFFVRQQSSVGFRHCTSKLVDRIAVFNTLVNWVERGTKP